MFKVGDRVKLSDINDTYVVGTLSKIETTASGVPMAHVQRDDGLSGSGINGSWTVRTHELKPVQPEVTSETFKQKAGKPRWSILLGPCGDALKKVIDVREYGIKKYAKSGDPDSWKKVPSIDYADSAVRHLQAYLSGEEINAEDGNLFHLAQAAIDCLFALSNDLRGSK